MIIKKFILAQNTQTAPSHELHITRPSNCPKVDNQYQASIAGTPGMTLHRWNRIVPVSLTGITDSFSRILCICIDMT